MFKKIQSKIYSVLRWSQRYTKTDMVYLASGSFWISANGYLTTFVSFLGSIVLVNSFASETYGLYKYVLSIVSFFQFLLLNGMMNTIIRSVAKGEEGIFKKAVRFRFRWSFIYTLILSGVAAYHFIQQKYTIAVPLLFFSFLFPIYTILHSFAAYLNGKKEFRALTIYNLIIQVFVTGSVVMVLLLTKSVVAVLLTYALTSAVGNAYFYLKTLNKYRPSNESGEEGLHYGKHLTLMDILGASISQLDNLLLFHFWGAQILAQYAIVKIPIGYIGRFSKFTHLFSAKLSEKDSAAISKTFYKRIMQALAFGGLTAAAYALVAPLIFKLILPLYTEVVFYSQLLAIGAAFAMPISFIAAVFFSQKFLMAGYLSNIVPAAISVALYATLGIFGGLGGMVAALILSRIFGFLFLIVLWEIEKRKRLRINASGFDA